MRVEELSFRGFQGFNDESVLDVHDKLTVVFAPNSFGKTSICEGLEWLLYGSTSRIRQADFKTEYSGSYRNVHVPGDVDTWVRARFAHAGSRIEFLGILTEGDQIRRLVDGAETDTWPICGDPSTVPRPFVLQHSLKNLLLVKPDERFQGFARLLGFEELDLLLRNMVALCTKPEARIPRRVKEFLSQINALECRLAGQPSLSSIESSYQKGANKFADTYRLIIEECRKRVPPETPEEDFLPQLLKIREDAATKVFEGRITLQGYSDAERELVGKEEESLLGFVTKGLINDYIETIGLSAIQRVLDQIKLFDLGLALWDETNRLCPFCGQAVGPAVF